jgi:ferritin heavy chain
MTSAARTEYTSRLEAAINEQIKCVPFQSFSGCWQGLARVWGFLQPIPASNQPPPNQTHLPNRSVEYSMSYIYHSLAAFFDRDNVGLPGFAAYFKESSDDERHHANLLMAQQNRRGGRVHLAAISRPVGQVWGRLQVWG